MLEDEEGENSDLKDVPSNRTLSLSDEEEQLFPNRDKSNEKKDVIIESPTLRSNTAVPLRPSSCPICFEPYKENDKICSTKIDSDCKHQFHKACMVKWLLDHDDCPLCRANFLPSSRYR